jgi:hypothetical protein
LVDGISLTTVTGEKSAGDDGNGDESENLEAYLSVESLGIFHVALRGHAFGDDKKSEVA